MEGKERQAIHQCKRIWSQIYLKFNKGKNTSDELPAKSAPEPSIESKQGDVAPTGGKEKPKKDL